jgi:predicted RNA binding protein YcfA (HicA-like mRNA interferase family)
MKLPRDVGANQLIKVLGSALGYCIDHQSGSHIRIVTTRGDPVHHETIPYHNPIKVGTLARILKNIASHHQMTVEELLQKLDL